MYKGSTSDFGSDCRGSNPLGATTLWDNNGVANNPRWNANSFTLAPLSCETERSFRFGYTLCVYMCRQTNRKKKAVSRANAPPTAIVEPIIKFYKIFLVQIRHFISLPY